MVSPQARRRGRIALGIFLSACASAPPVGFPDALTVEPPDPGEAEAVLFLIGDAGDLEQGTSPIVARLAQDVEEWAGGAPTDSAVTVVFLGDNVYPVGNRPRDHPEFEADSSKLWGQVEVLGGPSARTRGARGLFLAGNHDWGNRAGPAALERLRNQELMLEAARAEGWPVELLPGAGEPGPVSVDIGDRARLLLLDTHWFLQERDEGARGLFFERLRRSLADAGERHVIVAAHHPYQSAGPHGDRLPGMKALGLEFLLKKSGTLVQDLNSPIYGDLLAQLEASFQEVARPLIFAAGHDHSLQVMDPATEYGPRTVLVSGAGSKLSDFADSPLLRYAASRPGYMTVIFRTNGAVDLFVTASPSQAVSCAEVALESRPTCVRAQAEAMRQVYSERLVEAGVAP